MGLRYEEIEPVFGLTRDATREFACDIFNQRKKDERIALPALMTAFSKHNPYAAPEVVVEELKRAGWLEEKFGREELNLSELAIDTACSVKGPRWTFDEACKEIYYLRKRLDAAPLQIDGVTINRLLLFGSTARDVNKRETVGDLDLVADVGFDSRYNYKSSEQRFQAALAAWHPSISGGDDRIGFLPGLEIMDETLIAKSRDKIEPVRPFVLLEIWANKNRAPNEYYTPELAGAVDILQARTLETQWRARHIKKLIDTGFAPTPANGPDITTP